MLIDSSVNEILYASQSSSPSISISSHSAIRSWMHSLSCAGFVGIDAVGWFCACSALSGAFRLCCAWDLLSVTF